ncbi:MAG: histidine kinase dimerization/phosphoacceptor domain -containing protein [Sulfitobacter sp.]
MDSEAESDFDDIVVLASKICEVPVSLISLVDKDRQWFKARTGFDPVETTLAESVCSHAILEDELIEIQDMAADPRTVDNPLHVGGPSVKFYAGVNLVAPNGLPIGTLCVLDDKPRQLTDFQRQALKTLSRQVVTQLELRKRLLEEKALRSEMDHRVRNSLQTIASVMRVASRSITDPEAVDVLSIVERRLSSVASLHSELMSSDGRESVDTQAYLARVARLLQDVAPDNISVIVETIHAEIDARKASAIGMIVSEFIANSIKHAFPDARAGTVHVSLKRSAAMDWVLVCRDDGVGKQESAETESGLGAMLMSSAASQLDGELAYETGEGGTALTVSFGN